MNDLGFDVLSIFIINVIHLFSLLLMAFFCNCYLFGSCSIYNRMNMTRYTICFTIHTLLSSCAVQSMASSNKETSIANVLRDFMVVKDKLDALKDQYETHPFGKQYTALAGNLNSAFSAMGVSEYTANAGEKIDPTRVLVVDEVYSTDFDKGTVVELLKPGLELKGNIIRLAECVGSLGEEGADGPSEEESENTEEEAEDL